MLTDSAFAPLDSPEVLHELIDVARSAPSVQNTQPWRFREGPGRVDVFVEPARRLNVADDDGREQLVSVGCALETLLIAADHHGLAHSVELFPRPGRDDLVATVRLRRRTAADGFRDPALFDAIEKRRTHRGLFAGGALPSAMLERLRACPVSAGMSVIVTDDAHVRAEVTGLVVEGARSENADPAYRRERAKWIGTGALGTPEPLRTLTRLGLPHVDVGDRVAELDMARMNSASAIAAVVSLTDDRYSRVLAGQALQRLWLIATHLGLAVQPMTAPLHIPKLRRRLGRALGALHACPQHLFRLGYAERQARETPRLSGHAIFTA